MRNFLPIILFTILFSTSCSDIFEKQIDIYEEAVKGLEDADNFQSLMDEALNTETLISQIQAKATEEERIKLKDEYGELYQQMLDSIETIRNSYYSKVDRLFLGYTYNFVERRILLYKMAADRYCKAEHIEELNAIKELIRRYSQLSFVESQRSCDPPAKIREEYESTKNLAENCYEVARKRIEETEKED